jgi:hypothetical protein
MILDSGNSVIKAKIPRKDEGEIVFLHAFRQFTESDNENITARTGTAAITQSI